MVSLLTIPCPEHFISGLRILLSKAVITFCGTKHSEYWDRTTYHPVRMVCCPSTVYFKRKWGSSPQFPGNRCSFGFYKGVFHFGSKVTIRWFDLVLTTGLQQTLFQFSLLVSMDATFNSQLLILSELH